MTYPPEDGIKTFTEDKARGHARRVCRVLHHLIALYEMKPRKSENRFNGLRRVIDTDRIKEHEQHRFYHLGWQRGWHKEMRVLRQKKKIELEHRVTACNQLVFITIIQYYHNVIPLNAFFVKWTRRMQYELKGKTLFTKLYEHHTRSLYLI